MARLNPTAMMKVAIQPAGLNASQSDLHGDARALQRDLEKNAEKWHGEQADGDGDGIGGKRGE